MKKLIVSLSLILSVGMVCAQNVVKTSTEMAKYEEIESATNTQMRFLLDKINGTVWQYGVNNRGMSYWEELFVQTFDYYAKEQTEAAVNYQIVIGDPEENSCYLKNVHTGQKWNFTYDKALGLYILLIDKKSSPKAVKPQAAPIEVQLTTPSDVQNL